MSFWSLSLNLIDSQRTAALPGVDAWSVSGGGHPSLQIARMNYIHVGWLEWFYIVISSIYTMNVFQKIS